MNPGQPFGSVEIVAFVTVEKYRLGNTTVTTTHEHHRTVVGQFPGALLRALTK